MRAGLLLALFLTACASSNGRATEVPPWECPGMGGAVRPAMGSPQPGEAAPDFELPRTGGGTLRLSSLHGSWVVVHFTATWCPYCDAEIAHLGELADGYSGRGVKVVVVDLEEDAARWATYARERLAPSVLAVSDPTGDAARRFAPPRAQPSFTDRAQVLFDATLVIDPQGLLRVFLLPDSAHFDPKFTAVRAELDAVLGARPDQIVGLMPRIAWSSGTEGTLTLRLGIAPGYHVMSNQPVDAFSIPTEVRAQPSADVVVEAPRYPEARPYAVADRTLSTFEGAADVSIPFVARGAGGTVDLLVRYQACTASLCLAPRTQSVTVSLAR